MKLETYLSDFKIPQAQFADRIGVTKVTLHCIVKGKTMPLLGTALKIERETYGKVTCEELYASISQEKGKKKQEACAKNSNDKLQLGVTKKTLPKLKKNGAHVEPLCEKK